MSLILAEADGSQRVLRSAWSTEVPGQPDIQSKILSQKKSISNKKIKIKNSTSAQKKRYLKNMKNSQLSNLNKWGSILLFILEMDNRMENQVQDPTGLISSLSLSYMPKTYYFYYLLLLIMLTQGLIKLPRLALNLFCSPSKLSLWSCCLNLPSSWITGPHHQAQLIFYTLQHILNRAGRLKSLDTIYSTPVFVQLSFFS